MGVQEKRMGILYICIITNEMEYYMNISLKAMFFSRSILLYHSVLVKFIGLWKHKKIRPWAMRLNGSWVLSRTASLQVLELFLSCFELQPTGFPLRMGGVGLC